MAKKASYLPRCQHMMNAFLARCYTGDDTGYAFDEYTRSQKRKDAD